MEAVLEVNVTASPELALAEIAKGRSVVTLLDSAPKVIAWVCPLTRNVCVTAGAGVKLAFPA